MENTLTFLGIDVSKKTLDLCLLTTEGTQHLQIANTAIAISRWLKTYASTPEHASTQLIIALENTGRYDWSLLAVLAQMQCRVYVVSALHLSKSLGLVRGKTDKVDAGRIARFIQKYPMDLRPWQPSSAAVQDLTILLSERRLLVRQKRQLRTSSKERQLLADSQAASISLQANEQMLSAAFSTQKADPTDRTCNQSSH